MIYVLGIQNLKILMYYIMNIGFLPVVGGLVVGEAGGSAVVASVGG